MNVRSLVANVFSATVQRTIGFISVFVSLRLVHEAYPVNVTDLFVQLSIILIVFQFLDLGIGNVFVNEYSAQSSDPRSGSLLAGYFFLTLILSTIGGLLSAILLILFKGKVFLGFAIFLWLSVALSLVPKFFIATNRAHMANWIYTCVPLVSLVSVATCSVLQLEPGVLYASGTFALFLCFSIALVATRDLLTGLRSSISANIQNRVGPKVLKQAAIWVAYQAAMFAGINSDYIIGRNLLGLPENIAAGGMLRVAYGLTLVSMISIPIWPWIAKSFANDTYSTLRRKLLLSFSAFVVASVAVGVLSLFILYLSIDWLVGTNVSIKLGELIVVACFVAAYNLWFGVSSLITSKDLLPATVAGCLIIFATAFAVKISLSSSADYIDIILTTTVMLMGWNVFGVIRLKLALARKKATLA